MVEVTLPRGSRIFRRHIGKQLVFLDELLDDDTIVDLSHHEKMIYDHRDVEVMRGHLRGEEFFVLQEEMDYIPTA